MKPWLKPILAAFAGTSFEGFLGGAGFRPSTVKVCELDSFVQILWMDKVLQKLVGGFSLLIRERERERASLHSPIYNSPLSPFIDHQRQDDFESRVVAIN